MTYEISERVVLITGAARGIGADAARRLVDRGARVALLDRDAEGVERQAASLGDRAIAFAGDVTDWDSLQAAVDGTVEHFGGIDVVVANAGISGPPRSVMSIDPGDFEAVIEINLLGVWRTVRAALPHVVARKGSVLPIASVAALIPAPLLAAYVASKHGVDGFARSLALEIGHTGTRVGVGYFSFIDTDMVRDAYADPVVDASMSTLPKRFTKPIPVGAAGKAIVRGIERRSRNVYAPRWVPGLIAARGLGGPVEGFAARDKRLVETMRRAESAQRPG